ncbi:MAG: NTP transferase domain-containing protein [Deltaproteobacteria bacterium]|nr:NTP transferase domain-containing protein [Deltaproteobacteria bacterium]
MKTGSVILAAGRGSRMKGYAGNKTLLPLVPGKNRFEGRLPILLHILTHLPPGPRAVIVHHAKEAVMAATRDLGVIYREQLELNGTGGALLAAEDFLKAQSAERIIITMGDVPFVRTATYMKMIGRLTNHALVVLGFRPGSRKQYGVLETAGDQVLRIIEWKYWHDFPEERKEALRICNSGIYAVTREAMLHYLPVLASRPHVVHKEVDGRLKEVREYFITDLVEFMQEDGLSTGYIVAEDEEEVMGVDDLEALERAQEIYRSTALSG